MIEETRWVRARVHMPIIADESLPAGLRHSKLKDAFDGVNVKLERAAACWRRTA